MGFRSSLDTFLNQYLHTHKWRTWIKGLVAATVTGSAQAIVVGGVSFSLSQSIRHQITLIASMFVTGGLVGVCAYLVRSPLPPPNGETGDLHFPISSKVLTGSNTAVGGTTGGNDDKSKI